MNPRAARLLSLIAGLLGAACAEPEGANTPTIHPEGVGERVEPQPVGRFDVVREPIGPLPTGVALGDCNGDGLVDAAHIEDGLYVQRPDGSFEKTLEFYELERHYAGGTFADVALGPDEGPDGKLDLVLGLYGVDVLPGNGDCTFGAPRTIAGEVSGWAGQIITLDADRDGLTDFSVTRRESTDAPYRLLLARGDGTYEDATPKPTPSKGYGADYLTYGTYFDDVDGDGALDAFILLDHVKAWFSWGVPGDGFTLDRDDALSDRIAPSAPMALSPIDVDRDGRTDYFIAGSRTSSLLLWNRAQRELHDIAAWSGLLGAGGTFDDWGTLAFDADYDGWTDLLTLRTNDLDRGPGPVGLLMSRRDGTFADVAPGVIDERLRAQSLVCADLASDGRMGCFARDLGGNVLLRNRLEAKGRWLGLRLRGVVSSPDASGARVSLDGEERPLVVTVDGQSPDGNEHARDVLLAIGDRATASVTITWPSGLVQRVTDLPAETYTTVVEPPFLTLTRRVAPADGAATVEVVLDPTLAGATSATLEKTGAGAWQGPATTADGVLRRTLVASAEPGEARVDVTLDGVPLRVRPRIRFE